jgi:hypothetical protein
MIHSAPVIRPAPMIHSAPMIRSAPMVHSAAPSPIVRPLSGFRGVPGIAAPQGFTHQRVFRSDGIRPRITGRTLPGVATGGPELNNRTARERTRVGPTQSPVLGNRNLTNPNLANRNLVTRQVRTVGRASVLRNNTLASLSPRDPATRALARTTFQGRFAGQNWRFGSSGWNWRHRHRIVAIGWFGPLFWPYAYWDFIDYTFWPYAYDAFWPYAYDDLYVGMFGPYAYEGPDLYSALPAGRRVRVARRGLPTTAAVCSAPVPALMNWPIQQIADTVQPSEVQQAALNDLKEATAKALEALQSSCPNDLPNTPPGRLAAMRERIETMLKALNLMRPPLQRFYDLLNDEQKAHFNAINPVRQPVRPGRGSPPSDLSQVCSGQAARGTNVPTERIVEAIKPSDSQRNALDALNEATAKAAEFLKANCTDDETLTPPGRVAAMEQRLNAMIEAIKIVQPALEKFYGSLTDEQKARFNQLTPRQS